MVGQGRADQLQEEVARVLSLCYQLQQVEDPEEQPYKSLYAAADALQSLLQNLTEQQQHADKASDDSSNQPLLAEATAWVRCLRGVILLQTDLLHDGEEDLNAGLQHTWSDSCYSHAVRARALNALGALCQERSKHSTAQQHLKAALKHYQAAKELPWPQHSNKVSTAPASSQPATAAQPCPADGNSSSSSTSPMLQLHMAMAGACGTSPHSLEQQHALTLVGLAQVAAARGQPAASAAYCAAGLNSHLATGSYMTQLDEWIQNCLQLSAYYMDVRCWGTAAYCQAAASALLAAHGIDPAAIVAACGAGEGDHDHDEDQKQQQQQMALLQDVSPAGPHDQQLGSSAPTGKAAGSQQQGDTSTPADAPAAATTTTPATAAAAVPPPEQHGEQASSSSRQQLRLAEDVAANVLIAQAKLLLSRLQASYSRVVEQQEVEPGELDSPQQLPACLRFQGLALLPELSSLPWGAAAMVGDYRGALALVQRAMGLLRRAGAYYRLDGWVTEHVQLLFDMSNAYRLLAGFEADPHRACVTHKQRAKLLQPLVGELSTVHYLGLVRSLHLELGNVYRAIHEIKEVAGWPAAKVAAAGREAAVQYQAFLNTYSSTTTTAAAAAAGVWEVPEDLAEEDQDVVLQACFALGRVLHKCCAAEGDLAPLQHSLARLRGAAAFVKARGLSAWGREAALAEELADLVGSKIDMSRQLAALKLQQAVAGRRGQLGGATA